jgi:hypothetical protein
MQNQALAVAASVVPRDIMALSAPPLLSGVSPNDASFRCSVLQPYRIGAGVCNVSLVRAEVTDDNSGTSRSRCLTAARTEGEMAALMERASAPYPGGAR